MRVLALTMLLAGCESKSETKSSPEAKAKSSPAQLEAATKAKDAYCACVAALPPSLKGQSLPSKPCEAESKAYEQAWAPLRSAAMAGDDAVAPVFNAHAECSIKLHNILDGKS